MGIDIEDEDDIQDSTIFETARGENDVRLVDCNRVKWESNGTHVNVPYEISSDITSENDRAEISLGILQFEESTCIRYIIFPSRLCI